MEFFQRELCAEFAFRFRADVEDLELADFVGAGLARHHDVALHFGDRDAVVAGLLAGPFFWVQAGVHDEAAGAEEFFVELAEEESVSGVASSFSFFFLLIFLSCAGAHFGAWRTTEE